MEQKKSYYAIIPADVRYDDKLIMGAKLLYGEITALSNEKGFCWASNSYFSELYSVTNKTISNWLKSLEDNGYIYREVVRGENKEIVERKIFLDLGKKVSLPYGKKVPDPREEKVIDNNTSNNTLNSQKSDDRYSDDSPYIKLANRLEKHILNNNPNYKFRHKKQTWADDFRKTIELDGRDMKEVIGVLDWCQRDDFWHKNILSPSKFREQYDKLVMNMPNKNNTNHNFQPSTDKEKYGWKDQIPI